jgi:hypothetical protein
VQELAYAINRTPAATDISRHAQRAYRPRFVAEEIMHMHEPQSTERPLSFTEIVKLAPDIGMYFEYYRAFATRCGTMADMRAHWLGYGPVDAIDGKVADSVRRLVTEHGLKGRYTEIYRTVENHFLNCRPELANVPPGTRHAFCENYDDDEGEEEFIPYLE